jgi:hypothetical protein
VYAQAVLKDAVHYSIYGAALTSAIIIDRLLRSRPCLMTDVQHTAAMSIAKSSAVVDWRIY